MENTELFNATQSSFSTGSLLFDLFTYLMSAIIFFFLAKKAGNQNAWFAFVPILNLVLILQLINRSAVNLLWILSFAVPMVLFMIDSTVMLASAILLILCILILILVIIMYVELLHTFGMSGWWVLVLLTPFSYILLLYMAFSKNVQYVGITR